LLVLSFADITKDENAFVKLSNSLTIESVKIDIPNPTLPIRIMYTNKIDVILGILRYFENRFMRGLKTKAKIIAIINGARICLCEYKNQSKTVTNNI